MKFSEKVRACRKAAHMTQEDLAKRLGKSKRTIEGYEAGHCYPRTREVYQDLAQIFNVDVNFFLTEDATSPDAKERARQLIESAKALYAGGELKSKDKDALAQALMDAYFIAKAKQNGSND